MYIKRIALFSLCSTASCFTPSNRGVVQHHRIATPPPTTTSLNLADRGWDNGNFLDALGEGEDSIENANAKYQEENQVRSAWREKQFQRNFSSDDDGNVQRQQPQQIEQQQQQQGGFAPPPPSQFQNSMNVNTNIAPPPPPMPQQVQHAQPIQTPSAMDPQAYYQALQAWQQAMVAFQQFSAANPTVAAQMTPPAPPPPPTFADPMPMPIQAAPQAAAQVPQTPPPTTPPPTTTPPQAAEQAPTQRQMSQTEGVANDADPKSVHDYLPKRAGGNNDAYEVNNAADVYFAQLKRDSYVRTEARKNGDLETANAPFAEVGVVALGGLLSEELTARRREQIAKNGGEFETSRDEMILPSHFQADEEVDKTYTGESYKQRLIDARQKKDGQE